MWAYYPHNTYNQATTRDLIKLRIFQILIVLFV